MSSFKNIFFGKILVRSLPFLALFFVEMTLAKNKAHPVENLSLSVGVYRDVPIPNAPNNFSRGGTYAKLVSLRVLKVGGRRVLRFTPNNVGIGTLFIKNPGTQKIIYEFIIDIKRTSLQKVSREVQLLLKNIEGIFIKVINNKVIVDGEVLLPKDITRISSVMAEYPGVASSLVTLSVVAQAKIARLIEAAINNPEIHVRSVNGVFLLEGVAKSIDEKKRAVLLAETYVPSRVVAQSKGASSSQVLLRKKKEIVDLIIVKEPPKKAERKKIIQLIVHYVELSKDYGKGFKFQWSPDLGENSAISFGRRSGESSLTSTLSATIRNLIPKLNWAKEHGHARILKSISLLTENGVEGKINSTTRIPFIVGSEGQTKDIEVGIKSAIVPTIVSGKSDSIQLRMSFAVGAHTGQTSTGLPLTSSNDVSTSLVVRSGYSAAVGGLISNESSKAYNKLPRDASPNPIVSFYSSRNFQKRQGQFVVFITPIIKVSASAGADRIKKKFNIK